MAEDTGAAAPLGYLDTTDDEEDSDDSFSVSSSSSSDEPPDEVRDKRLWRIHARLLRKAGLQPDHATHFKLSRVTDLGKGMLKRLPRQQPGRATRFVQTFTPMPKHEVIAQIMDILAEPRGRGFKCLHGTDIDGYTKKLKGWKPTKEQRKAVEFIDVWKRQAVRKRHKRSRVMRAKIRARRRLEMLAAAHGQVLPPAAWELKHERNEARLQAMKEARLEAEGKLDRKDTGLVQEGVGAGLNDSDSEVSDVDGSGSDDDGGKSLRQRAAAEAEADDAEDPGEVIRRMAKNNGPYQRKPRNWNFRRDAVRKFNKREYSYDPDDHTDDKHKKHFPRVVIKTPRGNVVWRHDDKQYVQWLCTAPGVETMKVELFKGVDKVKVLAPSRKNDNGVLFVTVDQSWGEGESFRIKVTCVNDASVYGFSPAFFAIKPSKAEARRRAQRDKRQEEKRKARVRQEEGVDYQSSDEEDVAGHYTTAATAVGARLVPPKPRRGQQSSFVEKAEPAFRYIVPADHFSNYKGERNKRGRPHGHGVRTYMVTGATYTGQWKQGMRHGRGVLSVPNGAHYDGEWEDDEMHGKGVLTFANGAKYTGTFARGKRHGRGKLECSNGFTYVGTFANGEFHGHGTATGGMDSGVRYEGRWADGRVCGMGRLTYDGGKQRQRIWEKRRFASTLRALYAEERDIVAAQQARFDHLNRVHKELLLDDLVWTTRKVIQEKQAEEREELIRMWKEMRAKQTASAKWAAKKAARALGKAV